MSAAETHVMDVDWLPPPPRERVRYEGGLRTPARHVTPGVFKRPAFKYALILHDILVLSCSFVLTFFLRTGTLPGVETLQTFSPIELFLLLVFAGAVPVLLKINGLYKIHVFTSVRTQIRFSCKALGYAFTLLVLEIIAEAQFGVLVPDWTGVLMFGPIMCGIFLASRVLIFRNMFHTLAARGVISRSILIVGAGPRGQSFATNLARTNGTGFHVAGFLDESAEIGTTVVDGAGVIGRFADVARIVSEKKIDEVVICLDNDSVPELFEKIDRCSQTRALVMVTSPAYDIIAKKLAQECYGTMPVVGVNNFNKTAYAGLPQLKRAVDILVAVTALVLLSPLLLIIMIAIKLESRGPILYKQTRVGKDGKLFTFYKFRSMTVGADVDPDREENYAKLIKGTWNPTCASNPSKIMNTAAVTRVGKIIRKLSIDEVPQLIHVITGDMSIVGPRPCIPYEWKHYEPWHRRRFSAVPGCTGLWQVFGRSKVSFDDMIILDVFYSQNVSLHMDIWLMLKTLPVMMFGRGAR